MLASSEDPERCIEVMMIGGVMSRAVHCRVARGRTPEGFSSSGAPTTMKGMPATVMLFWLALLLPGFVVVRRLAPDELEAGLPGGVAVCFVATLAILTPVSILGYLVGVPLIVLSATVLLAVVASLVVIARQGWWRDVAKLLATGLCVELAIIVVDMVLGGRVGAILGADAVVHLGRVRFLLDHGLTNADHFVAGDYWYPVYHTNLQHALLAVAAQLTRADHVSVWYFSLPMAKLLVVSGGAYAAWAVFRSRWAAFAVALFLLGHRAPVTFLLYPNQLAPWFLIPMLIGVTARALDGPYGSRGAWGVAIVALLLGQVHSMYAAFALLAVGPVVGIIALARLIGRRPERLPAIACAAALLLALPFPAIAHVGVVGAASDRPTLAESLSADPSAEGPELSSRMKRLDNGWVMHKIGRGFTGGRGYRLPWLIAAATLALTSVTRRRAVVLLGVLATVALLIHVPPLCTRLLGLFGSEWVLQRFATLQDVCFAILVPGMFASVAESVLQTRGAPVARLAFSAIALYAGAHVGHQQRPYDWRSYLNRASASPGARHGGTIRPLLRLREDLRENVTSGAVVLTDESLGMLAVALHDCRIIVPGRSGVGVKDLGWRRRDMKAMMRGTTPEAERAALMAEYGVTHMLATRPAPRWTVDRMRDYRLTEGDRCIIEFRRADDPADLRPTGDFGIALVDAGRLVEAAPYLPDLIATGGFRRRFRIANALYDAGMWEQAIAAYESSRELRAEDPRPVIMIGNAQVELGRLDDAIASFEETITLALQSGNDAAASSASFNLGNTHYRREDWAAAAKAYAETLLIDPEHAGAKVWIEEAEARLDR
jgi:hypothetical protein